ncbi:acyl-CoA dehydrogenase family protein [bacterium]|nr:acyl-CoA dehydrogenase family protein [candidate division CSSED10-310 bacterium]
MILDLIEKIHERMLKPETIRHLDETEEFPDKVIQELLGPNIGLQLLFIPEEYDGMGGGARDIAAVSEAMAKICLGLSTAFLAIHLGTDPIIVGGTLDQKKKWLGRIAEGKAIVAYAVTEPEAGSNLASLKTFADPIYDDAGSLTGYRLNGNKQFISNGLYADVLTVLANTPDGPSFFIVEKGMDGFRYGKPEVKHGIRCANTTALTFDNVFIPSDNLIGEVPGAGLQQANAVFGYTRLMVAAFGLGAGTAALEKVIPYAKQRVQFGSPLIEKQGYTHTLIVPHIVNLEAARAYIEETAERLDSGEEDLQTEGAIAKYFATEAGNACAEDAIQALGGYGYIKEYEVEKIKRDVKITTIYEGTSQIQQMIIGTYRWRSTVRSKGGYYNDIADEMNRIQDSIPELKAHSLAGLIRTLNAVVLAVHKAKLTRQQYIMFELAQIMTWVEVGAALIRKTASLSRSGASTAARLKIISRLFVLETVERAAVKLNRVVNGSSGLSDPDMENLLSGLMTSLKTVQSNAIPDMDSLIRLH